MSGWRRDGSKRGRARAQTSPPLPRSARSAQVQPEEIDRLKREIERLRERLAEAEQQIAEAEKRIADLERQLALREQHSRTSSKPPSSDGLAGRQRERGRRPKSRRRPGANRGIPATAGRWSPSSG